MEMVKRAFLRACINHSCLDQELMENILTPLCELHKQAKPANTEELRDFVGQIGGTIGDLGQTLTFIKYPITGKEYLVFTISDATPDKTNHPGLTAEECQYFSIILDKLAQADDYYIAWNEAYANLNFQGTARPPQKIRMQALLQHWNDMGYFHQMDDRLYLGPRSIIEFEFYLRSNYMDTIKECVLCKQIVLWDIKCSDCGRKVHRECIRRYLRTRSNCPTCDQKWSTRLSI